MVTLNVISIQIRALVGAGTLFSPSEAHLWAERATKTIADDEMRGFLHDELMVALAGNGRVAVDSDDDVMVAQTDVLKVLGRIEALVRGRYTWKGR